MAPIAYLGAPPFQRIDVRKGRKNTDEANRGSSMEPGSCAVSKDATLVWFRRDLRIADNPALAEAIARNGPVIPVYVHSPEEEGTSAPGAASRWWLHHALESLDQQLRQLGLRLILRTADSATAALHELAGETRATAVFWNRRYEPDIIARDTVLKRTLSGAGLSARSFAAAVLFEPWQIMTGAGTPYRVFTPFWKSLSSGMDGIQPVPAPTCTDAKAPQEWPDSAPLNELGLLPTIAWDGGLQEAWTPTLIGADAALNGFLADGIDGYNERRDFPWDTGTSALSPFLHFGQLSPAQCLAAARCRANPEPWIRQLAWRDFASSILYHNPNTVAHPLNPKFADMPWHSDPQALRAWQRGLTGFPIVDAGMRQLWQTGWMHNRVRMLVGSFLTKDLMLDWRHGAAWFHDTLVDADLANNLMGWQWVAGCGADAAPFFRIFNPTTQGKKFDGDGHYVRRWLPELAKLPNRWIHQPWSAPVEILRQADVTLGLTYPHPIVDHATARKAALDAYRELGTQE